MSRMETHWQIQNIPNKPAEIHAFHLTATLWKTEHGKKKRQLHFLQRTVGGYTTMTTNFSKSNTVDARKSADNECAQHSLSLAT